MPDLRKRKFYLTHHTALNRKARERYASRPEVKERIRKRERERRAAAAYERARRSIFGKDPGDQA